MCFDPVDFQASLTSSMPPSDAVDVDVVIFSKSTQNLSSDASSTARHRVPKLFDYGCQTKSHDLDSYTFENKKREPNKISPTVAVGSAAV